MLNPDELKFLESKIRGTISSISHEHYQQSMNEQLVDYQEEYPGWTDEWIKRTLTNLFLMIQIYLEAKQLPQLLSTFKAEFSTIFADENKLLNTAMMHPEGEDELVVLANMSRYLYSFQFFDYQEKKKEELDRLLSVLKNTGYIIQKIGHGIKNEADIYQQVRWILSIYFPSCRSKNNASFIQQFKTYNPDILIPELRIAIEYKYLRGGKVNVDDYLDQIKVDATNYIGDYRFDTFIAVLYIQEIGIATPESIQIAWELKHFPNNWNLVIPGVAQITE